MLCGNREIGVFSSAYGMSTDAVDTPAIIYILIILNISDNETITNDDAPNYKSL